MTRDQAVAEAHRRWGKNGIIFDRVMDATKCQRKMMDASIARVGQFWVGQDHFGSTYGNGSTWEAAFAESDRREQEKQK